MCQHLLNAAAIPASVSPGKAYFGYDSVTKRAYTFDENGVVSFLTNWDTKESLLYNGGFDFAQRQAPATLTTYSNTTGRAYGADRWGMTNENASIQYQRVDSIAAVEAGLNARFYGKFKKITSAGKIQVSQVVEGANTGSLRGRTVRVQAKMRYTVAASMTVRLGLLYLTSAGTVDVMPASFVSAHGANGTDPTWGTNLTALAPVTVDGGSISGLGMTCVLTGSWVRYSATFVVPTTAKNLIPCIWSNSQLAANDELNIAETGNYDGSEIIDWTPRPYAQELALCQRYYQKSFAIDTAPAQNVGLAGSVRVPVTTAGISTVSIVGQVRHVVTLFHALGAITIYNPSAANAFVRNVTGPSDATATSTANPQTSGFHVNCTGIAAWAVGNDAAFHYSVEADF